jgi:glycosyltransferase involved in cell wall biosynthesis
LHITVDGIIYRLQQTGGISRLFTEILPRICRLDDGLEMTILTSGPLSQQPPMHPRIYHKRVPEIDRYLRPALFSQGFRGRIRQSWDNLWIGRGKGRIWHSTYYTIPKGWEGLQVVTVADMIYERFPELFGGPASDEFRELKRRCVVAADAVLSISEATSRDVQQFYGLDPKRLHVVHLACSDFFRPLDRNHPSLKGTTEAPFFLYVGSRAHYKNFHGMITAYSLWQQAGKTRLLVVGPPWTSEEQRSLAELGIQERVDLLTVVDDDTLCALYNRALAFIYPSLYEGFGIPLLEAMACGCPVIASRIDTTVEVAGECPIYFDLNEEDSMIGAFDTAVREGRESRRTRGALEHAKEFSWDKTARGTLEVYRSLF